MHCTVRTADGAEIPHVAIANLIPTGLGWAAVLTYSYHDYHARDITSGCIILENGEEYAFTSDFGGFGASRNDGPISTRVEGSDGKVLTADLLAPSGETETR